jgi:aspartate beta-hydroxylase
LGLINKKKSFFQTEDENLSEKGDWRQFNLFLRGVKIEENCKRAPATCKIIDQIPPAKTNKRGQVKFSIMSPNAHIFAHTGPTNCRLRAHLGLKIPTGPRIRVANETKKWIEGKLIIFDDSFDHEVWNDGKEFRLVLIVDLWHPDLKDSTKKQLGPI